MIMYHGTTMGRARKICEAGFLPCRPSKRVWFARARGYAEGRARTQARRAHDRPVVLTCDIDLERLRARLGKGRVLHSRGVVAVHGTVPVTALRSIPLVPGTPSGPDELAAWLNDILQVKPWKGVSPRSRGVQRLSRWVVDRVLSKPHTAIPGTELLAMARRWLPEHFEGYVIVPGTVKAYRTGVPSIDVDVREDEALSGEPGPQHLEWLAQRDPAQRVRALAELHKQGDPDLFEWCMLMVDDPDTEVRLAALHWMARSEAGDADPTPIIPLASSRDDRVRGAAVAVLTRHGGREAPVWAEYGLKDPSACVRAETAAFLSEFDPVHHRSLFETAIHDPNPEIARRALRLSAGHPWARSTYRPGGGRAPRSQQGARCGVRVRVGRRC